MHDMKKLKTAPHPRKETTGKEWYDRYIETAMFCYLLYFQRTILTED